ncbi:hypothetical protein CQW23_16034 [Capsicum baccatum]|uniref:Reverse transcriptase Ty1/copia-type domain-containing protein n=1 Tax=Capsicum baccatum TaxID=33114 RepID=A0A2G2WNQ8_CAPBA|nr:hypothetical protein CQW23_16034 [Capsicum baccatum]
MLGCKAAINPIEEKHKIEEKIKEPLDDAGIRGLWENVRYLTITRLDITYAMGLVRQYLYAPCQAHLHVVYRILRYLKGYIRKEGLENKSNLQIKRLRCSQTSTLIEVVPGEKAPVRPASTRVGDCKNIESMGSGTSSDNSKGGLDTSCASGITQLDLVSPNHFAVLEDPDQEEAKMPDLETAEPEEIAQDECLGNEAKEGVFKERTLEESYLAHRNKDLEERINYGSD